MSSVPAQTERTKRFHVQVEALPMTTPASHLAEVMVFFRLLEVKGFPLFFTRSCQQVVKHVVVSGETNVQVTQKFTKFSFYCLFKKMKRAQTKENVTEGQQTTNYLPTNHL